jgi:uncharacterized membrane protein
MNKTRLEALSDGVFAIVLTLLVIEIRVPEHLDSVSSETLWHALTELTPLFIGYGVTVVVLSMFWISHNFFYNILIRNINRQLALINLVFLALISLIPFSAHLLSRYTDEPLATAVYGINLLLASLCSIAAFEYAVSSHEIDTDHNSKRLVNQARIRQRIIPLFALCGIIAGYFISVPLALLLFMAPVLFNIIPGTLDILEHSFGISLGEK